MIPYSIPYAKEFLTLDGGSNGILTVPDTGVFYAKATVYLSADGLPTVSLIIDDIVNETELAVIEASETPKWSRFNSSAYTVALNAEITQPDQTNFYVEMQPTLSSIYQILRDIRGNSGVYRIAQPVSTTQGTPGPASSAWFVKLTDGTNTLGTSSNPLYVTGGTGGGGGPASNVTVDNFPSVQPVNDNGGSLTVDGTVSVGNFPTVQPVSDNGSSLTVDGTIAVSNFPATQPISGSVSVSNLPSVQPVNDNGGSLTIDGTVAVSNFPATQPISGSVSVSNFPATQPISAVSLPLPSGAATESTLSTRLTESTFITRIPTLGQKTMVGSSPVVIASDQSTLNVAVSNFPATQPVSAVSLPLPSGAATESTLSTRVADSTITARINTLGQKTMANSTPVTIASDQGALTVSVNNFPSNQTVSGTVAVSNFPATQPVSGSVSITGNVTTIYPTASLGNGVQTNVSSSAVQIMGANSNRKTLIIQNVGSGVCRIGITGVTSTTGIRLGINDTLIFEMPYCPTNAIFAIQDDLTGTTVLTQEIV